MRPITSLSFIFLMATTLSAQMPNPPQSLPPAVSPTVPLATLSNPHRPTTDALPTIHSPRPGEALDSPAQAKPPAAPPPAAEQLLRFDDRQVDLRLVNSRWVLMAGRIVLKDFGTAEEEGREALQLIRELRLNQRGAIGHPAPVMEYWLSNGRAPELNMPRHPTLAFDPATLRVEEVQGQWFLRDAHQMLFNFGAHADDARLALDVIRRHEFTQIAYVGPATPLMIYFLGGSNHTAFSEAPAPLSRAQAAVQQMLRLQTRQLAPASMTLEEAGQAGQRLPIDWQQVELHRDRHEWKLMAGGICLANFGAREWEAREALRAVQHYRFTEVCSLGNAGSEFRYFLVNGAPPRGVLFGLRNVSFRPESLTVRQVGNAWTIHDGSRALWTFGDREEEARQALAILRRYQFDHYCQVGNLQPSAFRFPVRGR